MLMVHDIPIASHPLFATEWYLARNPDVAAAGIDPFQHFMLHGWREKRSPHPLFDLDWYLRQNPDVAIADVNPLIHFCEIGWKEGRDPHKLFSTSFYLEMNADVAESLLNPLEHFCTFGWMEGRDPHPIFSTTFYLEINPDVAATRINPLIHFVEFGLREGRDPHPELYSALSSIPESSAVEAEHDPLGEEGRSNSSTYSQNRRYKFKSVDELRDLALIYFQSASVKRDIAIFTAITGEYDNIYYHEHLLPGADYFIFCDDASKSDYIFKFRNLPYLDEDDVRTARFVKTHPHFLLSDYRIAVWIDGNILIRGDLSDLLRRFDESGAPVGVVQHPLRTSVYDEANECILRQKDSEETIRQQMARYSSESFDCLDLIESNVLIFKLDHHKLQSFLTKWWEEIENGSRRDQLSFNYAAERTGIKVFRLTGHQISIRNHPDFALFHHGTNRPAYKLFGAANSIAAYSFNLEARLAPYRSRLADIIVCVHNALEDVKACLASVVTNRNPEKHRVILVDDGSNAETQEWLHEFLKCHQNVFLIRNEIAQGYTKAANAGLKICDGDLTILLNSDAVVTERWIEKLMDVAFSNPGVGIVGPMSNAASHQSIPNHRGSAGQTAINSLPLNISANDMNVWCEENSPCDFVPLVPLVHGFCFAITRSALKKIGLFDELNFPQGYGEENDYCFRATNAGFLLAIATHTYVFHQKSRSYVDDAVRIALTKEGNRRIQELHGVDRVFRAVRGMENNRYLIRMRDRCKKLYSQNGLYPE